MKLEIKRIILLINIISFLIAVPFLIFYAEGKKIIFPKNKIIYTGGIYIQSPQKNLSIFLNNKKIGSINILKSSFFYNQLEPKNYLLTIKKNGFLPVNLDIQINKGFVNNYFDVLLLKNNPKFFPLKENVDKILDIRYYNNKTLIYTLENDEYNLYLVSNNSLSEIANSKNYFLVRAAHFNDFQNSLILEFNLQPQKYFFQLINLQNENIKENINFNLPFNPDIIFSYPYLNYEIFYLYNKKLIKYNLKSKEKIEIANNVISFFPDQEKIFYLTDNGFLVELNIYNNSKGILNNKPFFNIKNKNFSIINLEDKNFIFSKDGIFLIENGEITKIFKGADNFIISPNKKRIIFNFNNELYCLQKKYNNNSQFEFIFLDRSSTHSFNFFWVSNNNFILIKENILKLFYLNEIEKIYFCTSYFIVPEKILFYNSQDKTLYLNNNKKILKSEAIF